MGPHRRANRIGQLESILRLGQHPSISEPLLESSGLALTAIHTDGAHSVAGILEIKLFGSREPRLPALVVELERELNLPDRSGGSVDPGRVGVRSNLDCTAAKSARSLRNTKVRCVE